MMVWTGSKNRSENQKEFREDQKIDWHMTGGAMNTMSKRHHRNPRLASERNKLKTRSFRQEKPKYPKRKEEKFDSEKSRSSEWTVEKPAELLPFLLEQVKNKGRNKLKSVLARGQVEVDGQRKTRHDEPLLPGMIVKIHWEHVEEPYEIPGLKIVYEDEDLIVVDKQHGLLSIASPKEKEVTAYRLLTEYVRTQSPDHRVFIVHRLDRDTSGLMIFAKNEEAKMHLQNAWHEMVPERVYYALVEGEVKRDEGTIHTWLKETRTLRMYSSPVPNGGQEAITHYKVIQRSKMYTLLEVRLDTGRKNQIRVHMESIGHPVVGDKKYGSRSNPIGRLGLHAGKIAFQHPVTGESMSFESKIPAIFRRVFRTV